jgi:arylsulfatase A-like enzyme
MGNHRKIILIVIDTLNVDHLGCYGYNIPKTPTTPFLDSLAEQGVVFRKHYATDVPTPSSFTSLFCGIRGVKHGIMGFNNRPSEFSCSTPHLAECFSKNGFRTGMISNLLYPCPWLVKGFQDIYPPGLRFQRGTAEEVTNESLRWLKTHTRDDFFLFVHYWDPHVPYFERSQEKYRRMFSAIEYRDFAPDMRYFQKNKFLKKLYDVAHKRDPVKNLALYDANIRYVDDNIKRLFSNLEEFDIKGETTVAITSDHGEAFGEYGFWDHYTCYRNISQLPLILLGPTIQSKNIESYTQNVDIMPTLLELAGIEVPGRLCGKTMVSLLEDGQNNFRREVVVNSDATVIQRMYVRDNYALVHSLARPVWDHIEEYELFNLSEDPDQLKDISSKERNKTSQMRLALGDWLVQELKGAPDPLQLSVFRGGWFWNILSRHMGLLELAELTRNHPETKKALYRKSILDLL